MKKIIDCYKMTSQTSVCLAIQFPTVTPSRKFIVRPKKGRVRTVLVEIKR